MGTGRRRHLPTRFELVGGGTDGGMDSGTDGGTGTEARVILRLAPAETKLLQFFSQKLSDDLLDIQNPRLYPGAHRDNPRLQQEFVELTGKELQASRKNALGVLAGGGGGGSDGGSSGGATGDHQLLSAEQLDQWVAALNVLHLALGARLENKGVTLANPESIVEDFLADLPKDDFDRLEIAAYFMMSDMLEEASQFMLDQLT